jgi:hypothetical protein
VLKQLLYVFFQASSMEINCQKTCFLYNNIEEDLLVRLDEIFGIPITNLDLGMKYLGFLLKPNEYRVSDWTWLLQKMEIELDIGHSGGFLWVVESF